MKIPNNIERVEVYYDGNCGMCCTFKEWVNTQEHVYTIELYAYQSADAQKKFSELHQLDPARQMIVRTNDGSIYKGAEGWVICLSGLTKYQDVAVRLSNKYMLPVAMQVCKMLSANRLCISKVFFRKKDKELRDQLEAIERDIRNENKGKEEGK